MSKSDIFLLVFSVLVFNACSKSNQPTSSENYMDMAQQKYGMDADYSFHENANKKLVLCKHQVGDSNIPIESWDYFVYEIEKQKLIFENNIEMGSVKWYSETEIEISKTPGTMTSDETMLDYAWIINVFTGKKTKKSEYLKKKKL